MDALARALERAAAETKPKAAEVSRESRRQRWANNAAANLVLLSAGYPRIANDDERFEAYLIRRLETLANVYGITPDAEAVDAIAERWAKSIDKRTKGMACDQ